METENLGLPYIAAAQAQKHVTHNEALRALDAIVHLAVVDRDLAIPPSAPNLGDRYLVASGGSGDWAGQDGKVAAYQDGAWMFYEPQAGWVVFVADESASLVFDGSAWTGLGGGSGGSVNPTALVGVNATADTTNRLSVASPATLLNHEGDDHQLKINKAAAADTASVVFQTGFSGRAEVGLAGDDDFHFKVSPDGTTFHDAIIIDKDDGSVTFPNTTIGGGSSGGTNPSVLVNGDFQINQRVFGGGALGAGTFGYDRWKAAAGGADVSLSGYVVTLASGELEQVVEPELWGYASLASMAVTVSVENAADDLTVTFGSQSATLAAGSGRTSVTLSLQAGDTGNLPFKVRKASAGSTSFSRLKLEANGSATPWQARPRTVEEKLCQRYAWVRNAMANPYTTLFSTMTFNGSTDTGVFVSFPTTMRIQPAVVLSSPSHFRVLRSGAGVGVVSSLGLNLLDNSGGEFAVNHAAIGGGTIGKLQANNNSAAVLLFDAEL